MTEPQQTLDQLAGHLGAPLGSSLEELVGYLHNQQSDDEEMPTASQASHQTGGPDPMPEDRSVNTVQLFRVSDVPEFTDSAEYWRYAARYDQFVKAIRSPKTMSLLDSTESSSSSPRDNPLSSPKQSTSDASQPPVKPGPKQPTNFVIF